jgi:uncharacterized membrane protein YfcA
VTHPAVLFLGAFIAAALSGSAGFGGALLLLPFLTHSVGPDAAVPLLTLAQIVGNATRVTLGIRQLRWRPVLLFLLTGVPAAVFGALCFISIPKAAVVRLTGAAILIFVLFHLRVRRPAAAGRVVLLLIGALSGFVSGLVGSAGPLGSAAFLSLGLPPVAYIASDAAASLCIHIAKTITYQQRLGLSVQQGKLALLLSVAMILGTIVSKRIIERLPPERFRVYVTILLLAIALMMVIKG